MKVIRAPHRLAIATSTDSSTGGWPRALRIADTVYLGAHEFVAREDGSSGVGESKILAQTHRVFKGIVSTLRATGLEMADLMKLHTYYVFEGEGSEVTRFWEQMTEVRMQYLANPGPAATALRVRGAPTRDRLISIDGIASSASNKRRLMPTHAWDWSVPTPFSQGWLVGNKVYVGGQISADREGRAVAPGNVLQQTRNTLEYIRHVLAEAGAEWSDLITLKIGYRHEECNLFAPQLLDQILSVVREVLPAPGPALTCFGVDLLYEGLLLEIDAMAVIGGEKYPIVPPGSNDWSLTAGFCAGWRANDDICISAMSAPGGASLATQVEGSIGRVAQVLAAADSSEADLVKMNVFFTGEVADDARNVTTIAGVLADHLPAHRPTVSFVWVPELPRSGQRVQIDALAVVGSN
jgi:enamine deaminase RidA (YjgF/YER057c/UK114 family)